MAVPRILLLGSGGREHAMARALCTSPGVELLAAPDNPGLAALAAPVWLDPNDPDSIARRAAELGVDLVLPGPEAILCAGIADALQGHGIACCGPTAAAARIEASKSFMRELTSSLGVPGPRFRIARDVAQLDAALDACERWERAPVVKADGLMGGKGVALPGSRAECSALAAGLLARSGGAPILLEERLVGEEASLFYACCGEDCVELPSARDHKRLHDGDRGPNTGGMGAISPSPALGPELAAEIRERIVRPTLRALRERGTPFSGFLYAGLMITAQGPALLEFNVRLGDPEAQAILPRLEDGEFLRLCQAIAQGRLRGLRPGIDPRPTCALTLCAAGYPEAPRTGDPIAVDERALPTDSWLVYAGARRDADGLRTSGGRVLNVVARGDTRAAARALAYRAIRALRFTGMHYRTDIGL